MPDGAAAGWPPRRAPRGGSAIAPRSPPSPATPPSSAWPRATWTPPAGWPRARASSRRRWATRPHPRRARPRRPSAARPGPPRRRGRLLADAARRARAAGEPYFLCEYLLDLGVVQARLGSRPRPTARWPQPPAPLAGRRRRAGRPGTATAGRPCGPAAAPRLRRRAGPATVPRERARSSQPRCGAGRSTGRTVVVKVVSWR